MHQKDESCTKMMHFRVQLRVQPVCNFSELVFCMPEDLLWQIHVFSLTSEKLKMVKHNLETGVTRIRIFHISS